MSTAQQQLAAMEAVLAECGISVDSRVHYNITASGAKLDLFRLTEVERVGLVCKFGEPERKAWAMQHAHFLPEGMTIIVYDWPWPTCETCGQVKPEPVTA